MKKIYIVYNHPPDLSDTTCGYGSTHKPEEGKCRDSFNNIVYISNEFVPGIYERADINHCSFLSLFAKYNLPADTITVKEIQKTNKKGIFPIGLRFDLLNDNFENIMSKIIHKEIINLVNQNKLMLVLYDATSLLCGIRGFEDVSLKLKKFLQNNNIDLKNILLISNYNYKNNFCKTVKWNVLETSINLMFSEKSIDIDYLKKINEFNLNTCVRFLLFNSRNRFHRFVLTCKLYNKVHNFQKKCWYSLKKIPFKRLIEFLNTKENKEFLTHYNSVYSLLSFKKFLKTLPAHINIEQRCNNGDLIRHLDKNIYEKSGIFIVTDGSISTPPKNQEPFLTEKVFKTIGFKMPFIFYGEPGSLNYLKKLGYKTFNELWCEDYDNIVDPAVRADAIVDIVNKLSSLTANEFIEILKKAYIIVEHNFQTLKSRQTEKDFIDHVCEFVNN